MEHVPARPACLAEWPAWVAADVVAAVKAIGVTSLWTHQAEAASLAACGSHVVVSTGTASGKSMAYLLPSLSAIAADESACVLYLSPTKALAADQLSTLVTVPLAGFRPACVDGDTAPEDRDWARSYANYILTNPDLVARGILPQHHRWARVLKRLRYVVIDECHIYRGVFGSHVAAVLRRLRRLCEQYGSSPVFVLCSATSGDPALTASRLTGLSCVPVVSDGSPRGATAFALYEPPLTDLVGEQGAPIRRSALSTTADILADLVASGTKTLAFVRSRRGAEVIAATAREGLSEVSASLAASVAAYRGGYLPEERRALEAGLLDGSIMGVAATSALELGIDVSGLDAVVIAGWPGTLASLWQQAGRAGRSAGESLAVFVARDDPLDTYVVTHPETIFGRPMETIVLDPSNPYVLTAHLEQAARERPLVDADLELFGPTAADCVSSLVSSGQLRRRPTGWYATLLTGDPIDIRGTGGSPVQLVEASSGRLLGSCDGGSAHSQVHEGAVYIHQGRTYSVLSLDLDDNAALLEASSPEWTTTARDVTAFSLLDVRASRECGPVSASFGSIEVTNQVVSYLKRRLRSGEVLGEVALDLPPRVLRTVGVWWTVTDELAEACLGPDGDLPGALHAAEHAAIGLLPLHATCDRWDIGGVSIACHPDTGKPTVLVYDGQVGGAGFSERGFDKLPEWLGSTLEAVRSCECPAGCPSCVQSPKCGNGNDPLSKDGAVALLSAVLDSLGVSAVR